MVKKVKKDAIWHPFFKILIAPMKAFFQEYA